MATYEKKMTDYKNEKNFDEKLLTIHRILIVRYWNLALTENQTDLVEFCQKAVTLKNPDKLSRWVGYVQGCLIERKYTTVEKERDFSRKLYKPIYDEMGYDTTSI